ncbi:hypothetical protein KZX46_19950 [Polymorphobacter sp. PAMC 29334]|uniref:hypothetical protein n=1 Tax=Polymorphobacter sp. PAMC 29334 TaxID=2862331 RepID=UPI001C798619|nr:hypothetical protein [Polymorphobacter sp. PAMC 29334]QYE34971.1 hypothetical protein KZX46_19950 [Polymorphobacter sp. PAMC 29334]
MMRTALAVAAAILAGDASALPADRLATLIGDRIAGTPVDCIDRLDIDKVHIVDGGIVYEMKTGGVSYLNRPSSGASFIHDSVSLRLDFAEPRLCRDEPVGVVNENSRATIARAKLGNFVPYRRPVVP